MPTSESVDRIEAGVDIAGSGTGELVFGQEPRAGAVDDDGTEVEVVARQFCGGVGSFLNGQRFEKCNQMYDGLRRVQQPNDAFTLGVHRAALGEIGHRLGDVEEAADSSGRGSVDDNGVVHALAGSDRCG